jgi:dipeptide/tripeptide permease
MDHQHTGKHAADEGRPQHHDHYRRLYLMAALSFVAMFILMYAMVDRFDNVFVNLNQVYMAGLMAAPMVVIEIALMAMMYPDKKKNTIIVIVSLVAGVLFWVLIRQQAAIGDAQFLRSMIPHHAGAVLMCERLKAQEPEIKKLCGGIVQSQEAEIDQMKGLIEKLNQ